MTATLEFHQDGQHSYHARGPDDVIARIFAEHDPDGSTSWVATLEGFWPTRTLVGRDYISTTHAGLAIAEALALRKPFSIAMIPELVEYHMPFSETVIQGRYDPPPDSFDIRIGTVVRR